LIFGSAGVWVTEEVGCLQASFSLIAYFAPILLDIAIHEEIANSDLPYGDHAFGVFSEEILEKEWAREAWERLDVHARSLAVTRTPSSALAPRCA
jgi:hypothetical protein